MMRYFLLIIILFCLAGCVPYSDNPLTDLSAENDSAIIGTWSWRDKVETGYAHIGKDEHSDHLKIIIVEFDNDGDVSTAEFLGHTSEIEGNTYLNLLMVDKGQKEPLGYSFLKYSIQEGVLGIAVLDRQAVEKAILSGELKGEVGKGGIIPPVKITETQEALRDFIIKNDSSLFPEETSLSKVNLAHKS